MDKVVSILVILGALNMIWNISRFFKLMVITRNDVISSSKAQDMKWLNVAFALLVFFICGYLFVGLTARTELLSALVLFFGSVFVSIIIVLMGHLLDTAKERSLDIAEVLVGMIDARDPNLNGHSRNVQNITMLLYNYLPLDMKKDINPISLEYAALMHDIGKIGVPESILNKPSSLNDEEWKVMHSHPHKGVEILKPLTTFDMIAPWIEFHHERIDGKGYYGLKDEQIPLPARIIAIADTYSAITMKRSYKKARSHEEAITIMKEVAGTQLDADLVNIFLRIPKEELDKCRPEEISY
ncbi:MAG: HD-GYP domain-containing protein [Erysipelotrichaceae bacterium]|nr:HD-GYP domain-containing protein [Erysipelotrichaceae bacterium]